MIDLVSNAFENVIVVVNANNAMELRHTEMMEQIHKNYTQKVETDKL